MGIGHKPRGRKQLFNGLTANELVELTVKTVITEIANVKVVNSHEEYITIQGNVVPDVARDFGNVDGNTQRVVIANDSPDINLLNIINRNTEITKGAGNVDSKTQRVVIASDQTIPFTPRPNTTGVNGTNVFNLISIADTNAKTIKATGGNLYSIIAIGLTSTVRFLKLYNKSSVPNVGVDKPLMTIPIPANTQGAGVAIPFSMGVNFSNGISIAITANVDDNDNTAINAKDCVVNLTYA